MPRAPDLGWDKFSFRCVASDDQGEAASDKARLTVSQPASKSAFTDAPDGGRCTHAVAWAAENNVTGVTGAAVFSPNAACGRAPRP